MMVESVVKLVLEKAADHWEGITTIILIILYGRNDYRVSKLENKPPCRAAQDCDALMNKCSLVNQERFSDGRREFDGVAAAMNRLSDHFEDNHNMIIARLDKITDYIITVKTSQKEHYEEEK